RTLVPHSGGVRRQSDTGFYGSVAGRHDQNGTGRATQQPFATLPSSIRAAPPAPRLPVITRSKSPPGLGCNDGRDRITALQPGRRRAPTPPGVAHELIQPCCGLVELLLLESSRSVHAGYDL